ncbi:MAG: synthase protein [Clostridia bacterium]|nr:synthase protein [Clostridia bacterium]
MVAKKRNYWNYAKYANMATSIGVTMTAGIFLGFYGGSWLDRHFGTSPWLMLAGVLFGIAVGFYSIWNELSALGITMKTKPRDKDGNNQD